MAITITATPKIGGGLGNSKVIKFTLSGTYETGGFLVDFDVPSDAIILVNGFFATYDSANKKILLKTVDTGGSPSATTATQVVASTSIATQGIIIY